jgi:hypothetical protein
MKVDMSPEGVANRLRAMGELWELSVVLMASTPVDSKGRSGQRLRALEIQDSIRQVFLRDWDPIGIGDVPDCADEYDSYISPVYRVLAGTRSTDDLVKCLLRIEREEMEIGPTELGDLHSVAQKLLELEVKLY